MKKGQKSGLIVVLVLFALVVWMPAAAAQPGGETSPSDSPCGVSDASPGTGFSLRYLPETVFTDSESYNTHTLVQEEGLGIGGDPSMSRAILYSLLVPGLGDYYAGRKARATKFFVAEAAIWVSFAVLRIQSHRREDSYKGLASEFAGIEGTGHSDDFYSILGEYNSSADYEVEFKKEHRIDLWPDVGSEAMDQYYLDSRITDFEEWQWQSWERRVDFHELRSASRLAHRRSGYMLALAAANRVAAAIFAYHAVKSSRDGGEIETGRYQVDISPPAPNARGDYGSIALVRSF